MRECALGLDYGTNSVRALIVDVATGEEVATSVWKYQRGENGVWTDPRDPHLARQHPADYFDGFFGAVSGALDTSGAVRIVGIGVDTTGSTPLPVDSGCVPLAMSAGFVDDLDAMAWLWKDHTSHAEAAEITSLAKSRGEPYLAKCGGTYSSEWFWSKILRCLRRSPRVFEAAHSWVELQDLVPAWLCGVRSCEDVVRGACAAGHKGMYSSSWGGLPSFEFLCGLDPALCALRSRLFDSVQPVGVRAGMLDGEIAVRAGLDAGTPVSVGGIDAHLGAVGCGVRPGVLMKIIGTSTCDILVGDDDTPDIPGVCGIAHESVLPGMLGIEAGQSAVGDLFGWFAQRVAGASHDSLNAEAALLRPGQSGLVALDWNNGNRTILTDPLLSGLLVGQTLHTTAGEVYRALIEATAFGARRIIERIREYGVPVDEIVMCGGIAEKSPLTMQIYADVCGLAIRTSRSAETCALGAAVCGAVVGGAFSGFSSAMDTMTGYGDRVYVPEASSSSVYERLYAVYLQLHDGFGACGGGMASVMKDLLSLRAEVSARD